MDHETDIAASKTPEVDERVAAFQRGAPLPRSSATTPAPPIRRPKGDRHRPRQHTAEGRAGLGGRGTGG